MISSKVSSFVFTRPIWSPSNTAGITNWWKPDAGKVDGIDASHTQSWTDTIGSAPFSAPSTAFQPTNTNSINGYPVLTFDGTEHLQFNDNFTGNTIAIAMFVMVSSGGTTGNARVLGLGNSANASDTNNTDGFAFLRLTGSDDVGLYYNSLSSGTADIVMGSWQIAVLVFNGSVGRFFLNGVQQGADFAATANMNVNRFRMFNHGYTGSTLQPAGRMAELVLTKTTALSTSDRQKLEGYMAHKYAATDKLPASHPYKSIPPLA